jgi:hypothetical protein
MVRIAGLWNKQSDKGLYLKGKVLTERRIPAGSKLVVLPTKDKMSDSDPDYILYLAED